MMSATQDRCWLDRLGSRTGGSRPTIPIERCWPDRTDFGHPWSDQTNLTTIGQVLGQTVLQTIGQTEQTVAQTIGQTHLYLQKRPMKFIIYVSFFATINENEIWKNVEKTVDLKTNKKFWIEFDEAI